MKRATNVLWFLLFILAVVFMVVAIYDSWIIP
jgi:predicted nucleic acid-binding Zn ribbon protein